MGRELGSLIEVRPLLREGQMEGCLKVLVSSLRRLVQAIRELG